jgi:MFS family permease
VAAVGWGIAILAAALAPNLPLELAAMVFVGYGSITFNSFAKTTLQLAARPDMRGRVMALWGLAWLGSTPIGGPIVGWVGQQAGARWSLIIGGLPTVICGLLALPAMTRIDRRSAAAAGSTVAAGDATAAVADGAEPAAPPAPARAARR